MSVLLAANTAVIGTVDEAVLSVGNAAAAAYLTWANFNSELVRAANENGHNDNDAEFNDFTDYIFFDAAAFNLADNAALDTALTNETMSIADLDTYAAAYTP